MSDPATPASPEPTLPPSLRFLKWLVIVLMVAMIGGVITVVALLVTLMPQSPTGTGPDLPEQIVLPEGVQATAVTFGDGWFAVVTKDDRILVFGSEGNLRQDVKLVPDENP